MRWLCSWQSWTDRHFWCFSDSDLTHCSSHLQCVPPDEACTSLNVDMILAMMHNKKTFTKPLVITHEGKLEGMKMGLTCLINLYILNYIHIGT